MDEALRQAPIGVIEARADGTITACNDAAATLLDTEPAALRGTDIRESFPRSAAGTLRAAFEGDAPTATDFEEYYPRLDRWFAVDLSVDDTVHVYLQDRTDHYETTQRADRLQRRLDRLQRIETLIVTVLQQVIGATDRTEIARTLCDRLGGTEGYDFVWVGDRDFRNDRLRVVDTAGSEPDLRKRIETALGTPDTLPGQAAVDSGETRQVDAVAEAESIPRTVRQAAFGSGLQSALAVPLTHQGTVYGVLSVYSRREDGFSEAQRAGLETLGRVGGFAVKAIRQEELLVADTVTEVTLAARGGSLPLVGAASAIAGELRLDGVVPRGDGPVVCYLTFDPAAAAVATGSDGDRDSDDHRDDDRDSDGGDPIDAIESALADEDEITDLSWIRTEAEPLLQLTVDGESPVTALVAWGATVTEATYTDSGVRIVAETPRNDSVRGLIETVDETVEETELIAKSETTRNAEPVAAFRDRVSERLTDRQRTALRTAHLAGYFESPRGTTAEGVADALDITAPTLLYHLRRAERKLVAAFLSSEGDGDDAATDR